MRGSIVRLPCRLGFSPEGFGLLLFGISLVGYVFCAMALVGHGIFSAGGEGAGDIFAYWSAGRAVWVGKLLYAAPVGGYAAYLYPPPLAQILAPVSLLPLVPFAWVWRFIEVVCLRYVVGSWRSAGIALLLWPPLLAEVDAGNVHVIIAAACAAIIRKDARGLVPAGALTKFATLAVLPLALRIDRRGLLLGLLATILVTAVSFALAPNLWISYAAFLPTTHQPESGWYNLGSFVPLSARVVLAGVFSLGALRWRRLCAVAVTLAYPVLWFHSLATLIAVATPREGPRSLIGTLPLSRVRSALDRGRSLRVAGRVEGSA